MTLWHRGDDAVAELRSRTQYESPSPLKLQPRVERDLSKRDDDTDAGKLANFRLEMTQAAGDLFWRRLVVRRSASDRRQDVRIRQLQPVAGMTGCRHVGESATV